MFNNCYLCSFVTFLHKIQEKLFAFCFNLFFSSDCDGFQLAQLLLKHSHLTIQYRYWTESSIIFNTNFIEAVYNSCTFSKLWNGKASGINICMANKTMVKVWLILGVSSLW